MGDQRDLAVDAPFPLTEVDKWILSQTDEEFKLHSWEDLKSTIGECHDVRLRKRECGILTDEGGRGKQTRGV